MGRSALQSTAALILLAIGATGAQAHAQVQTRNVVRLVGMARDSVGIPVPNVEVWIRGTDLFTHTNEVGGFRFSGAPEGNVKITLRRIGFEQATVDLELRAGRTDSLVVQLTANTPTLAAMNTDANARSRELLAGFWERRTRGSGHYLTHDEIVAKNAQDFSDIVRSMPGVSVVSQNGRRQVRFSRSANFRGDCPPLYILDGLRLENASGEEFPPQDIEAIELYNGSSTIPVQFQPRAVAQQKTCGAIVIWTRLPGT